MVENNKLTGNNFKNCSYYDSNNLIDINGIIPENIYSHLLPWIRNIKQHKTILDYFSQNNCIHWRWQWWKYLTLPITINKKGMDLFKNIKKYRIN